VLIWQTKDSSINSITAVDMISNYAIDIKVYIFGKLRDQLIDEATPDMLELTFGSVIKDTRTGWETIRVTVKGYGVFGKINQYPLDYKEKKSNEEFEATRPAIWRRD
jgi:hypothetical protein